MCNDLVFISDNTSGLDTMDGHGVLVTRWQSLGPDCILILIITGKVIMNVFIFGARHRTVNSSLLGYCCIFLAIVDFLLLFAISAIHYFQDFAVLGFRFTNYHICVLTQIISHTYGILHLPFLLASGLDYYLTIVKSIHIPHRCSGLLYTACVLLLWTSAFAYVLLSPIGFLEVDTKEETYQCSFYTSSQSFYLAMVLIFTIFIVLFLCCFEMGTLLKSLKVTSYAENTVVLFSFPAEERWPMHRGKRLVTTLLFSFLGTWTPFLVLQIILLVLCAHIPGYMDMNVPWLYFMNSFLIGVSFGLINPDLPVTEEAFYKDPFISWKYSILPFMDARRDKATSLLKESPASVLIV